MDQKKIAFLKRGSFSHLNEYILKAIKNAFPEYKVDVIDFKQHLLKKSDYILNYFYIVKEYGWEIILRRKKFKSCTFRTTFIFNRIKNIASGIISRGNYTFSFQTQSIFDAGDTGIPHFLYTDHTHLANLYYSIYDRKNLFSKDWIALEKSTYHHADIVFTMSSNISKSVIEQYNVAPSKVQCIFAGYNVKKISDSDNEEKYYSKNILFVGIDWERKGGPTLIKAFNNVLKIHPDASLYIVGCSPDIDCPNCVVVGKIPLDEVAAYYEKCAIFCLPTTIEPFGVVFLEAAAYKLPIVATTVGAIPDIVTEGENGYLVGPGEIAGLTDKLVDLLNDPEKCQKFGTNNFKNVSGKYNWDAVGERIREHIEPFLGENL